MRRVLYAVIIGALFFVPLERINVSDLEPVEAVAIYKENEMIVIETDMGSKGSGENAKEALADLKRDAASIIYLDTARYLIVHSDVQDQIDVLRPCLKGSVKIYIGQTRGDISGIVDYLSVHRDLPKLREWLPERNNEKK